MSLLEEAFHGAAWDESEHPRWGRGQSDGGKFRPKAAGSDIDWEDPTMKQALEDAREVVSAKSKTPKVKQPNPRDQGIPEVYLSESGKFKPGYDAKLKSDLVNSALDTNPQQRVTKPPEYPADFKQRMIDDWKARHPSQSQDSTGREWTDDEVWDIIQTRGVGFDVGLSRELRAEYNKINQKRTSVESTLLHRFEPEHAMRILEERGWTKQLDQARGKHGYLIREPDALDVADRTKLERIYGAGDVTPYSSRGNFNVNGFHIGRVQETVGEVAQIPDAIHHRLADKGVTLYLGPAESTDLDEMWGIRDERARNGDRRTMKQVAGFYSPSSKRVIISADSRYGSDSLGAHEVGHAIGDVLGVDHHPELHLWHNKLKSKLRPYYLQNGNDFAGAQELWAEGVALHARNERYAKLGRGHVIAPIGPFKTLGMLQSDDGQQYMKWVRETLDALARGEEMPQNR